MELGIIGDLKSVVREITGKLKPRASAALEGQKSERLHSILKAKAEWEQRLLTEGAVSDAVPIDRLRLMRDLNTALGKDAILAVESGSTHGWFCYGFKAYSPIWRLEI